MKFKKKRQDLLEATNEYHKFIANNTTKPFDNFPEIEMTIGRIEQLKFLLENFNYCFDGYCDAFRKKNRKAENEYNNKNSHVVFKILKKFVEDKCFDSDFEMLTHKQTIAVLKNWWNINKNKYGK